jgi:putative transcriptional regulator
MMNKGKELKRLGMHIRQLRSNKNLTIEELASKSGKTYQVLQRLETGKENPSSFLLYEVAGGLGYTMEELLKSVK